MKLRSRKSCVIRKEAKVLALSSADCRHFSPLLCSINLGIKSKITVLLFPIKLEYYSLYGKYKKK